MADLSGVIDLFFADQDLHQLLEGQILSDREEPWIFLINADACMQKGEREQAIELLNKIVVDNNVETRIMLWSWAALRRLGVHPNINEADEVRGIVIQVPIKDGVDVLAAYADNTARYVNYAGKIIIWDVPDAAIGTIIHKLLESSKIPCSQIAAPVVKRVTFPSNVLHITFLTLGGNRAVEIRTDNLDSSPLGNILVIGAELLGNLMKRSQSMNQLMQESPSTSSYPRF